MRILVTGSNGQLGNEIQELSNQHRSWEFLFTDEKDLDITQQNKVDEFFASFKPNVVINCAAYTAVDKAESEEATAFLVNSSAARVLSEVSKKYNCLLIHVSTDYVFDGKSWTPYTETDAINPISVYGKSKAAGEKAILESSGKAVIIRTAWLYSSFGKNFVKTMLKYAKEKEFLNVVFDQTGTPTYARDLAATILHIIPYTLTNNGVEIYHFSNEGVISWFDFAKAITEEAGISCKINPINSKDYPQAAPRPFYSVLDKGKIKKNFDIDIPYWRDSLKECLRKITS
jgi:dTDP-4-dehydrorhamnose reductase